MKTYGKFADTREDVRAIMLDRSRAGLRDRLASDPRGFRVPFMASKELLTRLLTDALSGDASAYEDLVTASIHHHEYRHVCDAIKEKYGYED